MDLEKEKKDGSLLAIPADVLIILQDFLLTQTQIFIQ